MYSNPFHDQSLENYNFLITGGAGFIGSHLAEYLLKFGAKKVKILDNLSTGFIDNINPFFINNNFEFLEGDIRNLETCQKACKDVDFIFHQAALGSVPRSIEDPITTNGVNIDGFLNMLVAARDNIVKKFIYAASSSTYGDSKNLPKIENEIGKPLSPYAITKYVNELYAEIFYNQYGLKSIGLRYFNVFGPRQSPQGAYAAVIPLFIEAILKNISPKINGDGETTRDFTFISNVVQANIKSIFADEKADGEIFNVAVGESTSLNKMFNLLTQFSNSELKAFHAPEREGDIRNSLADISKAKNLLNYHPEIKIEEGLRLTLEWFKHNIEH